MADSHSHTNRNPWKYLSMALISILGIGALIGSASGAAMDPYGNIVTAINNLTTAIQQKETTVVVNSIEGPPGPPGADGQDGTNGLNCWDLDGDDTKDVEEDVNNDGVWNALDCQGSSAHNIAPVVDAGSDQTKVGVLRDGGGALGIPFSGHMLACEYDLTGSVQDDGFTGYLAYKWTGPDGLTAIFSPDDELTTHVTLAYLSYDPIAFDMVSPVTLTADDGILQGSDELQLTCQLPE